MDQGMLVIDQLDTEAVSHDLALPAGARLFEFEIESVLGYGSSGITYRAYDTRLRQAVAIKEYLPNEFAVRLPEGTVRAKSNEKQEEFKTGLEAFQEKARVMALFCDDHIIYVRCYFEMNGTGYTVLHLEQGQTLSRLVEDAPLPEAEFSDIFSAILDGVEAIHNRGILHHDLKPDNIMLRNDGSVVIIDFGSARDFRSRHSRNITAAAASGYSPPEQHRAGGEQGPWSDLYALGAIAYRCITGSAPPDSRQRLRNDPYVPAAIAAAKTYDKTLLSTIDWMLKVKEADRPGSVAQVRLAMRTGIIPPSPPKDASAGLEPWRRRYPRVQRQSSLPKGASAGLERGLKQVVTAEFGDQRSARKFRARSLTAVALLLFGTIVLSVSGLAVLKAESISEIACARFETLCTSWQTALLKASACFTETDACKASSCTAAFRSRFPADVLPARLATLESAARETCGRVPEDALNAAKRCAAQFAGLPAASCEVIDCYEDYLTRFPDGRGAGEVKESVRKANAACQEPRIFNQAVACTIANPCKAVTCFGAHRSVYPDGLLRPQADLMITRAARSCASTDRESREAPAAQPAAGVNSGRSKRGVGPVAAGGVALERMAP
jgi:serine/threonine protein kinase